ncbi:MULTISPECIES: ABC transporter permease [Micromonospora]|uniref:ABC transporter permease n=1 Tax=Micromonospora TaxID=1873 RepID=UPI001B359ECE|nr:MULTISPECIES: ABC transporter permease [unclassified Micromonospora]MBQ0977100.1 ABC transporter permease [Micromonospora sp. M61]MBQ1037732.1 ABC transporter permease [Micromonospora sp. C81]WTI24246.1 ABC transporter permease [Micromonospora zamorensis]
MNVTQATRLVAEREIRVKLRDRTFLFGTLFFLLIAAAGTILPPLLSGGPDTVAVTQEAAGPLRDAGLDVRVVADDRAAEQAVRDGDVDAAVVSGPKVLAMDESPTDVVQALSTSPPVQLLDPDAVDPVVAFLVPFVFAFVFFITSQTFGLQIAQSVTEEKQTRIVEILVAAVPVRALLAGKVVAGGILAFAQIALIAVVAVLGMQIGDSGGLLSLLAPAIGWFVPFFLLGFVLLAAMWAAAGALANRQEDIAAVSTPVQFAVMLPFFAVIFLNDNATAMRVLSYLPFSSPTAMPLRLFTGDAATWEPIVSLVILLVAAAAFVIAGARVYEGSLLRTNGRTSLRAAWRERETIG